MIEHSQHYLLQAQVSYWREMIAFNSGRLAERVLQEMHRHLKQAMQELSMAQDNQKPNREAVSLPGNISGESFLG